MKKNKLLLLASVCTLLTGCGGQKYTNSIEQELFPGIDMKVDYELKLKETTFKMEENCSLSVTDAVGAVAMLGGGVEASYKFTYEGTAEQSETNENEWELTATVLYVTDYKSEGDGKKHTDELFETIFLEMFTEDTVENILAGKKVKIELEEDKQSKNIVTVDNENMTFTISGLSF